MKFIFCCILVCFSCIFAFAQFHSDIPQDDAELSRIINETALYAKRKYNLDLMGTGISCPGGIFLSQGLSFQINHQFSKEKSREILLDVGSHLKNSLNACPCLIQIMEKPPFTLKNVQVIIIFKTLDWEDTIHPEWAVATLNYGKFEFLTNDPDKKFGFKTEIEEDCPLD